jgi:hypothetical protein
MAYEVGRAIAKKNAVLLTGATRGIPAWAARGAKAAKGLSIGFSPAATKQEHMRVYRLPVSHTDLIVYTGFNYAGRNLLLTRAADAVIVVCGRIGTLNEFTIGFEDKKPIGILAGSGGITSEIRDILNVARRGRKHIVFDSDPQRLVEKLLRLVRKEERGHTHRSRPGIID